MDKVYAPGAWKRLGDVLEARRGQLGYGFRQRERFLADKGGPPPSLKTLARLERGERGSYPPGTVTRLESMYEWAPGSFEAVLGGGDPVPLEGPLPSSPGPRAPAGVQEDEPKDDAAALLFPGDTDALRIVRDIWRLGAHGATWRERVDMIRVRNPALADALEEAAGQAGAEAEAGLQPAVQLPMQCNESDTLRVSGSHRTVPVRHH